MDSVKKISRLLGIPQMVDVILAAGRIIILFIILLVAILVSWMGYLVNLFAMRILMPVYYVMIWQKCTIRKRLTKWLAWNMKRKE